MAEPDDSAREFVEPRDVAQLEPLVRRVIKARVYDAAAADDLVQETLVRVLDAVGRVQPGMLEPYAIATAKNLVAGMWKQKDRHRRNQHRVIDLLPPAAPDENMLQQEKHNAVGEALARLTDEERRILVAHELSGQDMGSLAAELSSTAGAVAAKLNRTRAHLRVEYLLALEHVEPPTERCRPVLLAVSLNDRRRQRELDADRHLLGCDLCKRLSQPLIERGQPGGEAVRIPIRGDRDIVLARQCVREMAAGLGFSPTDLTVVATAVSEVARNIVRFANAGEIVAEVLDEPRSGVRVVARDTGPGIPDVDRALADGYSTYHGLGIGLPGARRLMDEFEVVSKVGTGTTVTMAKWQKKK